MGNYWNPEFDTMPWKSLQDYWLEKMRALVTHVTSNSEFYRNHLKNLPGISSFDSLTEMPQMTKEHIRKAQIEGTGELPLGSIQVAKTEDIVQIISSSGTTGRPVYYGITRRDLESWQDALANFTYTAGIRQNDIVAHAVGTPIFAGGEPYFGGMRNLGATVAWAGGLTTLRLLETIRNLHCTSILGTTSFDIYLAEHCEEFIGIPAKKLGVRKILGGGESGLGEDSIRRKVQELWGAETVREIMGLADIMPGMWAECECEAGMHFTASKYVMVELVDPDTGKHLPWEPGVCGEPIYTTILRDATPIVRYASHDRIRVEANTCSCGRTAPRIRCIGRVDDMMIYKAMNVFPSAIRDIIVRNFESFTTGYVQVVKDKAEQVRFDDPIPVDVEADRSSVDAQKLKRDIENKVRELLTIRINVTLVEPGAIGKTVVYKTPLVRVRDK
ncbi:MAG: phenylacetate--CoA ligase family protein [Pseudomonadota bacterium]